MSVKVKYLYIIFYSTYCMVINHNTLYSLKTRKHANSTYPKYSKIEPSFILLKCQVLLMC